MKGLRMIDLHLGDCLDLLPTIPTNSIDLIVVDPPYLVTVNSSLMGKVNPWADMMNAVYWFREWMRHCRRILKPTGAMWSFMNWKSIPIFQKSALDLEWKIESLLVWDKEWIGPGGKVGLRPSYEMVGLFPKNKFAIVDRSLADIQRFKWASHKPNGHRSEKPIKLVSWLIEISSKKKDVVLDCFLGSGTTGEAAANLDRSFIGVEMDEKWYKKSKIRIEAAAAQIKLPIMEG